MLYLFRKIDVPMQGIFSHHHSTTFNNRNFRVMLFYDYISGAGRLFPGSGLFGTFIREIDIDRQGALRGILLTSGDLSRNEPTYILEMFKEMFGHNPIREVGTIHRILA